MKTRILALSSTSLMTASSAALAQGSFDLNGFYAGIGYTAAFNGTQIEGGTPYGLEDSPDNQLEVFLGYNWAFKDYFVGAELFHSNIDVDQEGYSSYGYRDLNELRLKGGYVIGLWSVYAILAAANIDYIFSSNPNSSNGYGLGAGAAYQINENLFVGAELMHREFKGRAAGKKGGAFQADGDFRALSLRVGYKF